MPTQTKQLGSASASYTDGYPIALYLSGPRGGSAGYVDISPETARVLADELLQCAADAESGEPVYLWNVETRHPDRAETYFRGVRATNKLDAVARGVAQRNRLDPDAEIVGVELQAH